MSTYHVKVNSSRTESPRISSFFFDWPVFGRSKTWILSGQRIGAKYVKWIESRWHMDPHLKDILGGQCHLL